MIRGLEAILIGSSKASKLAQFYEKTVGLTKKAEWVNDDNGEEAVELKAGKSSIYIMDHSKIKGKAKDPSRIMLNIEVDDAEKETKRLKKAKVKLVQDLYHMEGYGYISTFADPEGNYFQIVQVRAN